MLRHPRPSAEIEPDERVPAEASTGRGHGRTVKATRKDNPRLPLGGRRLRRHAKPVMMLECRQTRRARVGGPAAFLAARK